MKRKSRGKGCGTIFLPKANGRIVSHIYRARWVADGKVYTRTTGTSDRREAEKKLAEFVHPFKLESREEQENAVLAKLQGTKAEIEAWKDAQPALGIKNAFAAYRRSATRPNGANDATLDRYEGQFGELVDWLAVHHHDVQELRHVTYAMAEAFADELKRTRTPNTFNKRITLYRSVWDHLAESARLTANPWKRIRKLPMDGHTRRALTADELARVCSSLDGEMRLLFAVGIYTGLRLYDAATLDWGHVDMMGNIISLIPHKTARHAHGKHTVIPIHPVLRRMLDEVPTGTRSGYLMPDTAATYLMDPTILSRRIQKAFTDCGIETHGGNSISGRAQIEIGFHSLRHGFVSLSANAGAPLAVVQAIVGHSSPAMTRHYFHETQEALANAVNALPDVLNAVGDELPATATDAAEARFRAFCEVVGQMGEDERARAAKYLSNLH